MLLVKVGNLRLHAWLRRLLAHLPPVTHLHSPLVHLLVCVFDSLLSRIDLRLLRSLLARCSIVLEDSFADCAQMIILLLLIVLGLRGGCCLRSPLVLRLALSLILVRDCIYSAIYLLFLVCLTCFLLNFEPLNVFGVGQDAISLLLQ